MERKLPIKLDLERYVASFGDNISESSTHYIVPCQYCIDNYGKSSPKVYILKDYTVGYCFRCENSYVNIKKVKSSPIVKTPITTFELSSIDCSYYKNSIELSDNKLALNYLNSRNKYADWDKYHFKSRYNSIVIPFYYANRLIYYQERFIHPSKFRYLNPPIRNKPFYMIPKCHLTSKCILSEGVFDVIALDCMYDDSYTKIGLLGKSLTKYQLSVLRILNFSHYYVYLDETKLSRMLSDVIRRVLNPESITIIGSSMDPEEYLNEQRMGNPSLSIR